VLTNINICEILIEVSKKPLARGCSSVVERNLAKVDVARSNRVSRLSVESIVEKYLDSLPIWGTILYD
jgi:hypothetical protein